MMKRCCESQEGSPESRKEAIGVKRAHRIEGVGKGGGMVRESQHE